MATKDDKNDSLGSKMIDAQVDAWDELQDGYAKAARSFATAINKGVDEYMDRAKKSTDSQKGGAMFEMPVNTFYSMMKTFQTVADSMSDVVDANTKAAKAVLDTVESSDD